MDQRGGHSRLVFLGDEPFSNITLDRSLDITPKGG